MSVPVRRAGGFTAAAAAALALVSVAPSASAQEGFSGTIKVSAVYEAPTPDNQANPGCIARIDYYNFKLGQYDVLFTAVPPSGTREVLRATVNITRESRPASDVQQSAQYRLNVSGLATDGPGYKLRVEVSRQDATGEGAKSKIFSFLCETQVLGTRNVRGTAGGATGVFPTGGFRTGGGGRSGALPLVPLGGLAVGLAAVTAGVVVRRRQQTA